MRRLLPLALTLCVGFTLGWAARTSHPPAPTLQPGEVVEVIHPSETRIPKLGGGTMPGQRHVKLRIYRSRDAGPLPEGDQRWVLSIRGEPYFAEPVASP